MGGSYAGWWGGALFPGLCAAPSSGWRVGSREGILGGGRGSPEGFCEVAGVDILLSINGVMGTIGPKIIARRSDNLSGVYRK